MTLTFTLNGHPVEVDAAHDALLLDVLRARGDVDTKEGCGVGVCGACTILVDEAPVAGCIYLAHLAEGREVWTAAGIARRHPRLLEAFVSHEGMQCGICTPGQVVSAYACTRRHPCPSRDDIRDFMSGNLCRCTGYETIVEAVDAYANGR